MVKRNAKVFCVQLLLICVGVMILQELFQLPMWVNVIIPATGFMMIYLLLQIYETSTSDTKKISRDGITGSRLAGIFVNSILFPWGLGLFHNLYVDILLLVIAILCLIKGKRKFVAFFFENNWQKGYWYIYFGSMLLLSSIYSFFSYFDIAPCGVCNVYVRAVITLGMVFIARITLPSNTAFALFVTKNYENRFK